MRCIDCEFRNDCIEVESGTVSFKLCGTRIEKLSDRELKDKLEKTRQVDYLKEHYGFEYPLKAKFIRKENRIYSIMDFDDGEEITFYGMCEKPSSNAEGCALYMSADKGIRLTGIDEIILA